MRRVFNIIAVLFLISVVSFANTPQFLDTLKVFPFDPVVVTGTRIETPKKDLPVTISIISSTVIDEQNYKPLLDLVSENVPGLFVTQRTNIGYGVANGSAGQISIRGIGGFPNTQVAVLIDGRPDIMGLFGHPLGDAYFMHDVEKIEVIRGPASVLYGSNAMGGAINIIPRHKHQSGFHLYVPVTYGSYNTTQSFIRNTFENDYFGYSLSAGYRNSDGFRTDGNDDYNSKSGNFEIHSQLTKHIRVVINSYLSDSEINDPRQISAPVDTNWYKISRKGGDLSVKHEHRRFFGELKLHHNFGHHDIYDGYQSDDYTTGLIFTETFQIGKNSRLTGGIDLKKYGGKALLYGSWKKHHASENSVYACYHQKFIQRLNVDAGLRYTDHSIAGNLFIPAFGISAVLPYKWILKGQYSEGYRNPTINELFMFMPSTTGLKQETTKNYEFTVEKQLYVFLTSSVTLYKTVAENLVQKVGQPPLYQNIGEVIVTGVEWEGQLLLPPRIALNWAASTSSFSTKAAGSPGEKVNLSIRYKVTNDLTFGLQGQWINNLFSVENPYSYGPINYIRLKPYTLLHLNANWNISDYLTLSAKIDNLTDTEYETMYLFPMPGRNFTFGITAKY